MSSFLDKQTSAFRGTLASAASKLSNPVSNKAAAAAGGAATTTTSSQGRESPAPSTASESTTPTGKGRRDGPPDVPFSQPQLTGYGTDVNTQVLFALTYLQTKRPKSKTLSELIDHLGVRGTSEEHKRQLAARLKQHPRVLWEPDRSLTQQTWNSGKFTHNPIIANVQDGTALLGYLQRKSDASGVWVKHLKDGWPDCEDELARLEAQHKVLIYRTEKGNIPRKVWQNDPSLYHDVQPEFSSMWRRVQLPSVDDMHRKLLSVGQKPTSDDPSKITQGGPAKQKVQKKRARKIGKATNVHMAHLMQDYSGMRR